MGLRVAIFEPEAEGHHMALHTSIIIRGLLDRGHEVHLVTTDRAKQHAACQALIEEFGQGITIHLMPDAHLGADSSDIARLTVQFRRLAHYRSGYQRLGFRPDAVYMVNLDQADLAMAVRGSPFGKTPFVGMLIGRQFHHGKKFRDRVFRPVFRRLLKLKSLRSLLILDELLFEHVRSWKGAGKVHHIPDVLGTMNPVRLASARASLGLNECEYVVLAYGALSLRKGVQELLEGMQLVPEAALLLAGKQDAEISPLVGEFKPKFTLVQLNRFLNGAEETEAFSAANVVWLGYRNWLGMSGVLLLAVSFQLPVICHDEGLIAHLVKKHHLGLVVNMYDPDQVRDAITQMRTDPSFQKKVAEASPRFLEPHSPESFSGHISTALESAAGFHKSNN